MYIPLTFASLSLFLLKNRNYWAHFETMGNAESTDEFQYWANQGVWQVRSYTFVVVIFKPSRP
jgi:hypothetical protein